MKTILLVDDDDVFRNVLSRAFERRGYEMILACSGSDGLAAARQAPPDAAVLDLAMPGESGLTLIGPLRLLRADMRILVLTGFASLATAVEAIKRGADQYLAKPAGVAEILAALHGEVHDSPVAVPEKSMSLRRLEWEHLQRVLQAHEGNISAAARALDMHRRTLQRKLAKKPMAR